MKDVELKGDIHIASQRCGAGLKEWSEPVFLHRALSAMTLNEVGIDNLGRVVEYVTKLRGIHFVGFFLGRLQVCYVAEVEVQRALHVTVESRGAEPRRFRDFRSAAVG